VLAEASDLLIHDSQYAVHEYPGHVGWGHSSLRHMLDFATLVEAKHLVPFHHDPGHSDVDLDRLMAEAIDDAMPTYRVTPGREGMSFAL
jgi:ribonuclease BN (tRNA processing enzyme)